MRSALVLSVLLAVLGAGCGEEAAKAQAKPKPAAPAGVDEKSGSLEPAAAPVKTEKEVKVAEPAKEDATPVVVIDTSYGEIKVELWGEKAPVTVKNFMRYVDEGFFDGTIFHRVMDGFMIQGGGFTPAMQEKGTHAPIKNEASKELRNKRGTIAMARTNVVDSATAQFFINLVDNAFLDHRDETPRGFGYAAFGKVISGMEVVDKIAKVRVGQAGPHGDVPVEPVLIKSVKRGK
jgi:cyclophilin family peptidyl-prolyl cis-trans isomerase